MAFSPGHYRSDSGGQGHGLSSIDGIHVKISEQCTPLQKVTLPVDYKTGNPSEVLFMEYDFNLESQVLEWSEQQRKEKEAQELAKQEQLQLAAEKLKLEEEAQAKAKAQASERESEGNAHLQNGTISPSNGTEVTADQTTTSSNGPFMNMSSDILTPTVLPGASKNTPQSNFVPRQTIPNSTSFNLADFENEQDPFDNLELKTLDDMAELNKVLQGAQSKADTIGVSNASVAQQQQNGTETNATVAPEQSNSDALATSVTQNPAAADASGGTPFEQEPAPLNIKDVEYPDFDTLETPDISLTNPSYNTSANQAQNMGAVQNAGAAPNTVENPGQVTIQPGAFPSVSFNNRKSPQNVNDSQRTGSPYSYSPIPQAANLYPQNQHQSNAQSNVYNYNMNNTKHTNPSSQHQQSVINGHTQYSGAYTNNPWASSAASTNPWSTQGTDASTTNKWEAPKSYTSNPWGGQQQPPAPTAASTNPWAGAADMYANSSSSSTSATGLRSAKSNPDLTKLTEKPVKVLPTSHTPPPNAMLSGTKTPPPRPSSNQSWNPYNVLPPTSISTNSSQHSASASSGQTESLPDPYSSLSHEMKRFVDGVTDMGFTRARVARAAQKLGQDDKKVLDHLCSVNKLSEQGLKADQAERALHLFDQQENKAKEYIKLLGQFKELGFPDDKIHEALVSSDLDENKTLDALTSS